MSRLSENILEQLGSSVRRPDYSRKQSCGVVHLGVGAFHRGHQAVYFDALLAKGETDWMIRGASLRSSTVANQLNPQDGLYSLVVEDNKQKSVQIIGSIQSVLVGPENPEALINAMADPGTVLVTLTITEKGYCIDLGTGSVDIENEGIQADIENIEMPVTAPGYLVSALKKRREKELPPFTVMSCDNIPHNGGLTRKAVIGLAKHVDSDLADWIETEGAFPSTMVDRIVPATNQSDILSLSKSHGYDDQAMVKSEPFCQWVIEDEFCNRRPPLDAVGAQFTDNVKEWEKAKLRVLNGAHSSLAYLGGLAGYKYIHEAIAAPGFEVFVQSLWDEVGVTLNPVAGLNVGQYRQQILQRFQNPALKHKAFQIATDGSQKIPQRFLAAWRERYARGLSSPALSIGIATWMKWQGGVDDLGSPYVVKDPIARKTSEIFECNNGSIEVLARTFFELESVFGTELMQDHDQGTEIVHAAQQLFRLGAANLLANFEGGKTS